MPEPVEVKVEVKKEETKVQPQEVKVEPKVEDLVSRVSQVKLEEPKTEQPIFNVNDIEKITDPQAKKFAQDAHKELERTYQKKFQELATIRKDYEVRATNEGWTPERLQQEMSKPDFVKSAQSVIGVQTDEYSVLTEGDKKLLLDAKREAVLARQENATIVKQQQDESLKRRYVNYAPDYVDLTVNNLISGKVQATREDIWKVVDYESAVKRAYQLGKEDRKLEQTEKIASVSVEGVTTVNNQDKPQKQQGESDTGFLKRLFLHNLQKPKQT